MPHHPSGAIIKPAKLYKVVKYLVLVCGGHVCVLSVGPTHLNKHWIHLIYILELFHPLALEN